MVNRNERLFVDIGERVKAVRNEIRMTLDEVSDKTGISRSYLSDFERGYRLPTSKYLKYLHDSHNINLNFIFIGEFRMFRTGSGDTSLNFGNLQAEVNKMLHFMLDMPHALFAMLESFSAYKLLNKHLIEKHRSATADRE